jgi:hypothetical protein
VAAAAVAGTQQPNRTSRGLELHEQRSQAHERGSAVDSRLRSAARRAVEPVRARIGGAELRAQVSEQLGQLLQAQLEPAQLPVPPADLPVPAYGELGLPLRTIEAECADYDLAALALRVSARGSTAEHLHLIARHGSALADVGCAPAREDRDQLLLDAAIFNLAVALIDSLVDEDAPAGAGVARVLSPDLVSRRLRAPDDPAGGILPVADGVPASDSLGGLYALCDALLVRLGRRFARDRARLAQLGGMLAQMHRSEFDAKADRLAAKALPVAFIGVLVDDGRSPYLQELYRELGALIGSADDWHDLPGDMRHLRANQFVLARDRTLRHRLEYLARGAYRLALPGRLAEEVVGTLGERATRVLTLARRISPETQNKTASVVKMVLGC